MSKLSHIIYTSRAIKLFSDEELVEMLEQFNKKNKSLGITGILLYDENIFFQVLEGEASVISNLYDCIAKDLRNQSATVIVNEKIKAREFSNWSMGFCKVNKKDLNSIEGMNDFFTKKECLSEVNPGIARKLLEFFSKKYNEME